MTPNKLDARAAGHERRRALAARTRMIRRRVIAGAVALFVAAWLLIAVALASGHDPALSRRTATVATSVSSSQSATTTSSSDSSSTGSTSQSATQSSSSSSPITTRTS
jgi:hypothetical protein